MQTMLRWVAVLGVLGGGFEVAAARDIYVDNVAGDDRFLGTRQQPMGDESGPVRSIKRALELADFGGRIVLAKTGEPYRESFTLFGRRHSGTMDRPFTIQGNGAILEGAEEIPANQWHYAHDEVFTFRPHQHPVYQQLFLNTRPVPRIVCDRPCTAPPELEPLEWCLYGGQLYFRTEPLKRPEDYPLTVTTRQVAITLFHVENVAIADLTIQGFQLDAVNAHTARHIVLHQVTCRGNGRAGIVVGGASLVNIESSLVGNNGEAQLMTKPYSETFVRRSNLLSNTAPAWLDQGGTVILDGSKIEGGIDERRSAGEQSPAES